MLKIYVPIEQFLLCSVFLSHFIEMDPEYRKPLFVLANKLVSQEHQYKYLCVNFDLNKIKKKNLIFLPADKLMNA